MTPTRYVSSPERSSPSANPIPARASSTARRIAGTCSPRSKSAPAASLAADSTAATTARSAFPKAATRPATNCATCPGWSSPDQSTGKRTPSRIKESTKSSTSNTNPRSAAARKNAISFMTPAYERSSDDYAPKRGSPECRNRWSFGEVARVEVAGRWSCGRRWMSPGSFEHDLIRERTSAGLAAARARGRPRTPPSIAASHTSLGSPEGSVCRQSIPHGAVTTRSPTDALWNGLSQRGGRDENRQRRQHGLTNEQQRTIANLDDEDRAVSSST
ncbi:hypothetical protein SAMN05444580_101761 [Rhodococcus tukisamuensis]|uniref:Uncharacterized protein n=1 Tax=Rhodococcus tukisamuensis TaxID=168276 RepID=A0A1G6P3R8_9NOCA|nr:hypothetical protein SAMN05444580_101761 [Rhodococcus tukisamuensis]